MTAIHADGRVYCSNAVIDGRFGLRACVMNFRTEAADVERLLAVAAELAERSVSGGQASGSFLAPRRVTGAEGGGTTGPMSPSGASSRSTITGA